jgi:hypothetical protein
LRRTGSVIWAENHDPVGTWSFSSAGWLDASGGLSQPNAGYFCFAATKPAGEPEACP